MDTKLITPIGVAVLWRPSGLLPQALRPLRGALFRIPAERPVLPQRLPPMGIPAAAKTAAKIVQIYQ